jgi:hypothetical protein
MKPLFCLLSLPLLLFLNSCDREEPFTKELSGRYDPATEVFIEAQVPRENSFLYRVSLENGARDRIPTSEFSRTLDLPLGSKSVFAPANNRSVFYQDNSNGLILQQSAGSATITDFIPITVPDYEQHLNWLEQLFFGKTNNEVWLSYNGSAILLKVDLEQLTISLLTDSLATGSIGLHRYLLDPAADRLYFFGKDRAASPIWADTLLIFNSNTFELEDSKSLSPVFAIIQDPASGRIFGLTAPNQDRGVRLAEIRPMDINPICVISPEDLPIDQVSTNLSAIHTATNTLIIKTGNNSIDSPTNFLQRIDLNTGELSATTEVIPGTIITGIFAE